MGEKSCSIEGCARALRARGWCSTHYARWSKHGDPLHEALAPVTALCSIDQCETPAAGRGWCSLHWGRWRRHGDPTYIAPPPQKAKPCSIDVCDRPISSGGLCSAHKHRLDRHGDPLAGGAARIIGDDQARFGSKVEKGQNRNDCWVWGGQIDARGYGSFPIRVDGATTWARAHRWSFEHHVGPIPVGMHLDHLCHDSTTCTLGNSCPHRRCVNPHHLRPVSNEENLRRAGRWHLTENQTRIAFERWCGGESMASIAASLGVHQSSLSKRFTRRGWSRMSRLHHQSQ